MVLLVLFIVLHTRLSLDLFLKEFFMSVYWLTIRLVTVLF